MNATAIWGEARRERAMKSFQIWRGDQLIGESDLEMRDSGMNVYSGRFYAQPAYHQVRSIFKIFSDALDHAGDVHNTMAHEYYRQRDELGLSISRRDGSRLSAEWIHIVDVTDDLDELQIDVGFGGGEAPMMIYPLQMSRVRPGCYLVRLETNDPHGVYEFEFSMIGEGIRVVVSEPGFEDLIGHNPVQDIFAAVLAFDRAQGLVVG